MSRHSNHKLSSARKSFGIPAETSLLTDDITEKMGLLIIRKDPEGKYLQVNHAWEEATGLKQSDAFGKTDGDLFPEAIAEKIREHDLSAIKSGDVSEVEECLKTTAGLGYFTSKRFPHKNGKGKITGLSVAMIDITAKKTAEKALEVCERKYQSLFSSTQVSIFRRTIDGKLLEINQRYAEIAGYSSVEECIKDLNAWDSWVDPKAREEFFSILKEKGSVTDFETLVKLRDGRQIWILLSAAMFPEEGTMVGTLVGIDERKKAELALKKSEAMQRKLVANIGDVIVIIDSDGINRYKSPNIEKMFGWKPEEVVGANTWENVHPDDMKKARHFFISLMKTPHAVGTIEVRYRCKDGAYRWIEFTASNLLDDPDIQGILGNYHDITKRRQTEQNLRESEARFKALHNASFGGNAIHDKGVILDCNQGLSEISGYSLDELIGMDGLNLISEKSKSMVMQNILTGYEKPYEAIGLRKDGTEYPIRLEARNIPYRGKEVRSVEFRDITEAKQAEEEKKKLQDQLTQAQKMESVGRLAGGVAHDYNNMLSVILGYTELALGEVPPSGSLQYKLTQIQSAAKRSSDITRQLLAFARKQTIALKVVDINTIIESMFNMLRRLIGEDIEIAWHPGKKLVPVKVDPSQIEQILVNLCVNARDAIGGVGKIVIETKLVSFDKTVRMDAPGYRPGDYVMLGITDDGCGMDKDTLDHIFEPFFTTKGMAQGTGLGLATVYGIVQQNNGFIEVKSDPDQGSAFRIYLPCYLGEAEQSDKAELSENIMAGGETVLLAEDEPAIREMCELMLKKLGYNVLAAKTPEEALLTADGYKGGIDLLLTDVVMPGMNGRELMERIRAFYPAIRTLFMSGYTADVIAHRGILEDEAQFIQKPFSLKDLGGKIRDILKKSKA